MLLLIMLVKFDALAQQLAICSAVQPARHYMLICYSLCNLRWDVVDMAQFVITLGSSSSDLAGTTLGSVDSDREK